MTLRAEARKLGLSARLFPPPDWYRGERPAGGLLACYSLLAADGTMFRYFRAERLSDGEWVVRSGDKQVLAALNLPPIATALIALEAQANAVSIWWTEPSAADVLPELRQLLQDLQQKVA